MISFQTVWPIFWFFVGIANAIRYPESRCIQNDCSTQIQPLQNTSCLMIHNTIDCLQHLSNTTKGDEIFLESEEEAKVSVSISPYTAQRSSGGWDVSVSAINISFVILKEGVDSLSLKIRNKNVTKCRFFEFQYQRGFSNPSVFFYNCFHSLVEHDLQYVQMDLISLPSNERLSYYVFIPPIIVNNFPCEWQPVVMIFCGSLPKGIVKVKFSHPPSRFLPSNFTVDLVDFSKNEIVATNVVSANSTEIMLGTEFVSVPLGYYKVIVKPYLEKCPGTETQVFHVGQSQPVLVIIPLVFICVVAVLVIICSFLVYKFCYVSHNLGLKMKKALLVYSHDNEEHEDFVNALVDFLNQTCLLEVSTIYGNAEDGPNQHNPWDYFIEKCNKSDRIIFLISQGLLITLDKYDTRKVESGHVWPTQLKDTWNYIKNPDYYNKICKIRFSYSEELKIPDYVKNRTGKCFNLPKDFNSFMSFAHGIRSTFLSNMVCPLFVADPSYSEVREKLELVPVADKNRDVVEFIEEPSGDCSAQKWCTDVDVMPCFDESNFLEDRSIKSTNETFDEKSDENTGEGQPLMEDNSSDNKDEENSDDISEGQPLMEDNSSDNKDEENSDDVSEGQPLMEVNSSDNKDEEIADLDEISIRD